MTLSTSSTGPVGTTSASVVRFVLGGQIVALTDVPPGLTLLDWLREHRALTGTKEGCRTGDCGACTVVVAELDGDRLRYRPLDACLTLMPNLDGLALWTVEDLASPTGALHPVQQALVDAHGSQCGFCTPGIVMSLFALYNDRAAGDGDAFTEVSRDAAVRALGGNLCRCTGYTTIIAAARALPTYAARPQPEKELIDLLTRIRPARSLEDVLVERSQRPDAVVVAGGTDVCVAADAAAAELREVITLHGVPELRRIERSPSGILIGAAAPLEDAWAALAEERPQLAAYAERFAGPQVRAAGTVGGNLATASPVGDCAPVLLALGASLRIGSVRGRRTLALDDFFLGYRRTALAPDELLLAVEVPAPAVGEVVVARKHSRRYDDDIAAVSLAVQVVLTEGVVASARIGVGGVAPTPVRARAAEAALVGLPWAPDHVQAAAEVLRDEFEPIDDLRAGAAHRRDLLRALLVQASQGADHDPR